MKSNRGRTLIGYLILAGLAVCFSAARLGAEDFRATFSLPFETHWGGAVLAAGDYSLLFDTTASSRPMLLQRGDVNIAKIAPLNLEEIVSPAKSQLLVVREEKRATVHILYFAQPRTAFHFKVPESYEVYTRLLTRADKPVLIQRIPVTVSGK